MIGSRPVFNILHGGQNGNELDAIGNFQSILSSEQEPDFLIFTFKHLRTQNSEYLIIPPGILRERLTKNIIRSRSDEYFELRLWLIDGHLYDTTNFGLEGEWYYLSKGKGGRMIDGTIWNYTRFLNNWVLGSGE